MAKPCLQRSRVMAHRDGRTGSPSGRSPSTNSRVLATEEFTMVGDMRLTAFVTMIIRIPWSITGEVWYFLSSVSMRAKSEVTPLSRGPRNVAISSNARRLTAHRTPALRSAAPNEPLMRVTGPFVTSGRWRPLRNAPRSSVPSINPCNCPVPIKPQTTPRTISSTSLFVHRRRLER